MPAVNLKSGETVYARRNCYGALLLRLDDIFGNQAKVLIEPEEVRTLIGAIESAMLTEYKAWPTGESKKKLE